MLALLGVLAPLAMQLLRWYLGAGKDASDKGKAMWEEFQVFSKAMDQYRSIKVHQSAKKQRDRLKDL